MKRIMMAALFACALAAPAARAAAEDEPNYTAAATARFVHLDFQQSRGQVQEYDGKLYRGAHGDVTVSNQGRLGLFDLSVKDIGSTEEDANLNADYKNTVKFGAKYQAMHHRLNERASGLITNNVYVNNPNIVTTMNPDQNEVMRRTESEAALGLFAPENSARWFMLRYWNVQKNGSTPFHVATYQVGRANVDNVTEEIRIGVGHDLGEKGAMSLDYIRGEFRDLAQIIPYPLAGVGTGNTKVLKPVLPHQQTNAVDARFRFDPAKDLAVTATAAARERANLGNLYKQDFVTGSVKAAYRVSPKLSLLGKLNLDADETIENNEAKYIVTPTTLKRPHLDKTRLKGELTATWKPIEKATIKASYVLELTNRRDAPTESFTSTGTYFYYFDGSQLNESVFKNEVARSDTRHVFRVTPKYELPLGMELEGSYQRLQANRAAFVGQPNRQDDASLQFTAPLPGNVEFYAIGQYVHETNTAHREDRNYSAQRNVYRTGLNWEANRRTFVGMDASYDSITYIFDGRFQGTYGGTANQDTAVQPTSYYMSGMRSSQRDTTLGANGRVNLPKGVVLAARGSYTWARLSTPLNYWNTRYNFSVDDYSPSDMRIARGIVGVEWTPDVCKKAMTVSASYSMDHWVDKTDQANSGRAAVTKVGMTGRF